MDRYRPETGGHSRVPRPCGIQGDVRQGIHGDERGSKSLGDIVIRGAYCLSPRSLIQPSPRRGGGNPLENRNEFPFLLMGEGRGGGDIAVGFVEEKYGGIEDHGGIA